MHTGFIKTAAILGALSVTLGAFAAHTLRQHVSEDIVTIFETGVRYQFYHVFALMAAGILYKDFNNKFIKWAGAFFIAGIILFSGSLYLLTYIKGAAMPAYNWIGAITPLGGLSFILGWLCLLAGLLKNK
jgi:uncharacterized membrane protein YgdD (TMEM256/DUF423 family)